MVGVTQAHTATLRFLADALAVQVHAQATFKRGNGRGNYAEPETTKPPGGAA